MHHRPRIDVLASDVSPTSQTLRGVLDFPAAGQWRLGRRRVESASMLRYLLDSRPAGIIYVLRGAGLVEAIVRSGIPAVSLDFVAEGGGAWQVTADEGAVGAMAGEHLLSLGHRRLAFCGFEHPICRQRLAGLAREAGKAEIPLEVLRRDDGRLPDWPELMEGDLLARWLSDLRHPTGLMCFNDTLAEQVTWLSEQLGIDVPTQLAVLGVDNQEQTWGPGRIALTSVELDGYRTGIEAARMLAALMAGRSPARRRVEVKPLRILQRRSTDIGAIEDPDIREALGFIRDYAFEGIATADVVASASCPGRTLHRKFRRQLNRTIGQEIRRVRLDMARHLLLTTRLPVADIAPRCGYNYLSHLSRHFSQRFGLPPGRYRARHGG